MLRTSWKATLQTGDHIRALSVQTALCVCIIEPSPVLVSYPLCVQQESAHPQQPRTPTGVCFHFVPPATIGYMLVVTLGDATEGERMSWCKTVILSKRSHPFSTKLLHTKPRILSVTFCLCATATLPSVGGEIISFVSKTWDLKASPWIVKSPHEASTSLSFSWF